MHVIKEGEGAVLKRHGRGKGEEEEEGEEESSSSRGT